MFLNRILATLRKTPLSGHIQRPTDFYKDINWFNLFLETFNGLVEIHQVNKVPLQVYVDASLRMVGGYFQSTVYAVEVPLAILNIASIVHLEAANILVAFKTWCQHWSNQKILLWCDNIAVVNAFSHHKMRDPWLTACVPNIWYFTSSYNIDLEVKHIQCMLNL